MRRFLATWAGLVIAILGGFAWGHSKGYRNGEIDGYNRGYLDGQNAVICAK